MDNFKQWIVAIMALGMITSGCNGPDAKSVVIGDVGIASAHRGDGQLSISAHNNRDSHPQIMDAKIRIIDVQIRSSDGNWFRFQVNPFDLNLLQPGASLNAVLARGSYEGGHSFSEVRLITEDYGTAHFTDGRAVALRVPSGSQTGIKIKFDSDMDEKESRLNCAKMTFDTSNSFVIPGNMSEVLFKPVVRVELLDSDENGSCGCDGSGGNPNPSPSSTPSPVPSPAPSPSPSPSSTPSDPSGGVGTTPTFPPIVGV